MIGKTMFNFFFCFDSYFSMFISSTTSPKSQYRDECKENGLLPESNVCLQCPKVLGSLLRASSLLSITPYPPVSMDCFDLFR